MKIANRIAPLALLIAVGCASPVFGSLTCSGQYFSETGVSASDSSKQQDAEACVTIGSGTITIVVQNDDTVVTNIPSILDGISLLLSGPATGVAFATPAVVATGFIDCAAGASCATSASFFDYQTSTTLTSPYNWQVVTGASGAPISTTFSTSDPALLAGGGNLHPAGIVGSLASTDGTAQHLGDDPHNDYLLGPVTFKLTFTGTAPTVTGATFYWGTLGEAQDGGSQVPEPTSVLLFGTVLAVVGKFLKVRLAANA